MKRLVLCVWILSASPVFATTYYVSKSGSGSTCSMASPCLTIATGLSKLAAGDTLTIGAGTYTEGIEDTIPSGINMSSPTTIQAASGATVWIDGLAASNTVIHIVNKSYIDLKDLHVDGRQVVSSYSPYMVEIGTSNSNSSEAGSHYVNWIRGEITSTVANSSTGQANCFGYSYYVTGAGNPNTNNTIDGADIHDCTGTCMVQGCHCIYLTAASTTIKNSTVHNCDGVALHGYFGNNGIDVDDNTIFNNVFHDTGSSCVLASSGGGYLLYNNVVYNCNLAGNTTDPMYGIGGIRVWDGASGTQVYNNTVYGVSGSCISVIDSDTTPIIKNNICYNTTYGIDDQVGSATCSSNLNATCASTSIGSTNPLFVDASGSDFSLQCHSPAIDTGTSTVSGVVTADFVGTLRPVDGGACGDGTSGYDIGAYEYIASQGPPPPPPYTGTPSKKPRLRIRIK